MKRRLSMVLLMGASAALPVYGQQAADLPPSAEPGQCFARIWTPELANEVSDQVIDVPERTDVKVIPATYTTVDEQVLVKEQTVRFENVPATYKTVTEQVLVEPERVIKRVVPAKLETYEERVLVKEAYVTWKPGGKVFGRSGTQGAGVTQVSNLSGDTITTSTGEILCRVEVPAEYRTVKRTRVVEAERTVDEVVPAKYRTVERQVIDTPATTREIVIPAVYKSQKVTKLVTPAREDTTIIPATYKTVTRRVVSKPGTLEWQPVLCDVNATPEKLAEVQRALTLAGYPTTADGAWGPSTLRAMENYQRSKGLPEGYLTLATMNSLGVRP
jgi:hypothetical protein